MVTFKGVKYEFQHGGAYTLYQTNNIRVIGNFKSCNGAAFCNCGLIIHRGYGINSQSWNKYIAPFKFCGEKNYSPLDTAASELNIDCKLVSDLRINDVFNDFEWFNTRKQRQNPQGFDCLKSVQSGQETYYVIISSRV
jgi:hypothetical protein